MAGGRKKNKVRFMPDYVPSDEETEAYIYCVRNNIRISPKGDDGEHWYIEVFAGNKWNKSKHKYDREQIWPEYYRCCLYYYDKRSAD